jgi:MinD-like ATPase involved in chromosome partitioning or flagellar assembly
MNANLGNFLFDDILPTLQKKFTEFFENYTDLKNIEIIVNRDLNGRVRLIVEEKIFEKNQAAFEDFSDVLYKCLGPHGFPADRMVLTENNLNSVKKNTSNFLLDVEKFPQITVVDRLATETRWTDITQETQGAPRVVFFSIKGGVGRSTALAVAAWSLAQAGKRVLVLDLDLESPGLSSSLLPSENRPTYGIADWLIEDLVDNSQTVFEDMVALSPLSHDGEIYIVPAHGRAPKEYIAKLERVWMPKINAENEREPWDQRLNRLLNGLEKRLKPDAILIDSRAGIDEISSACLTSLGAQKILLFALNGEQTWTGYRILLTHWLRANVIQKVRERLQIVGAMIPEVGGIDYFDDLREQAWNLFTECVYDEIPAGEPISETFFNYDERDEFAPHCPWPIRWHRGFAALQSIHSRIQAIDLDEAKSVFGPLLDGIHAMIDSKDSTSL